MGFLAAGLAAVASLALGFVLLLTTGHDDAYLTFWPAYTLSEFGEIVNYNGERVEQSSSLLYTLILAGSAWLTNASIPLLGYWFGVLFGGLAAFRAPALAARLGWRPSAWLVLAVGSSPCLLYWCFGSLETTLAAWIGLEIAILGADIVARRRSAASPLTIAATLAYVLVRPEAGIILVTALVASVVLFFAGRRAGRLIDVELAGPGRWLLLTTALFGGTCLFRWLYFGQIFPQPVAAKVGGDLLRQLVLGARDTAALAFPPSGLITLVALASLPVILAREIRRDSWRGAHLLVLMMVAADWAFVMSSGGDWMPAGRFFVHFTPVLLVLLYGLGIETTRRHAPLGALLMAAWLVMNLTAVCFLAATGSTGRPLWSFIEKQELIREHEQGFDHLWVERANQIHTRDIFFLGEVSRIIDRLLLDKDRVSILSGQAGMIVYYLARRYQGRIEFIDRHGLSTRHFMPLKEEGKLAPGRFGLALDLGLFFRQGAARAEEYWRPDLIIEVSPDEERFARSSGYTVVLEQHGTTAAYLERRDSPLYRLFGREGLIVFRREMWSFEFVAVRDDLASRFDRLVTRSWSDERAAWLTRTMKKPSPDQ